MAAKKAFIVNFKAEFLGKNDKVSFPLYFCIFVFFFSWQRSGGYWIALFLFVNVHEKAVKVILWYIDVAGRIRFLDH